MSGKPGRFFVMDTGKTTMYRKVRQVFAMAERLRNWRLSMEEEMLLVADDWICQAFGM